MKRVAFLLAAVCVLSLGGCMSFDPAHNRKHYQDVKEDFHNMHYDIDKAIGHDKPSPLRNQERP
ncbi:MAG: hypothetical protein FJ279_29270 [Planctomycetes bacterium]|nr:hypothetical protein [Planctomycetota bacterium]MBM4078494.1 hypothetical protein [Planctomycetota bacterium]MBM4083592.1 hypothetical protein [Planctomycetota bacterium]